MKKYAPDDWFPFPIRPVLLPPYVLMREFERLAAFCGDNTAKRGEKTVDFTQLDGNIIVMKGKVLRKTVKFIFFNNDLALDLDTFSRRIFVTQLLQHGLWPMYKRS